MILTYKIRHGQNYTEELKKAKQVADFAIKNKDKLSSKFYKHIGLKSTISSQIAWKYGRNKKIRSVHNVNLIVPGQGIKRAGGELYISCLKLNLLLQKPFLKVNQIELDKEFAFVSVTVLEEKVFKPNVTIGVDRNATCHIVVASCPQTGKVWKLGKSAQHTHTKYKQIRRNLQKKGKFSALAKIKKRESNIVRNLNHKISRKLVDLAKGLNGRLALENLEGIKKAKSNKAFRYTLHSWSFYQLQTFLDYKAKLAGVSIVYVDPYHTSKCCSRCGLVGIRNSKKFTCPTCKSVEHADANAGFSIANVADGVFDFRKKEISERGALIPHKGQHNQTVVALEPHAL